MITNRLTYKSTMGDYGSAREYDSMWDEICTLRNALGKYEDICLSPNEIQEMIDRENKKGLRNEQ